MMLYLQIIGLSVALCCFGYAFASGAYMEE